MDIRNFFGKASAAKRSSQSSETKTESKIGKQDSKSRRNRKDSNEHAKEVKKESVKKESKKSKGGKHVKDGIIDIDDDDGDFQADENGNKFNKVKTKDEKSQDSTKSRKEPSKKVKEKISSDDEMEENVVIKSAKGGKRSKRIIDSDSEDDPTPKKRNRKSKTKNGEVMVIEDSDDEDRKQKKSTLDAFLKTPSPSKNKLATSSVKKSSSTEKKSVNIADFFGGGSVKRSDRKTAISKRKLDEDNELHDDDDFEKTLQQLDESHKSKKPRVEEDKPKLPQKTRTGGQSPEKEKSSLSSKLAAKAKETAADTPDGGHVVQPKVYEVKPEVLVPDTPVSKKSPKKPSPRKVESPKKKSIHTKMEFTPKKTSPGKSEKAATPKSSPDQEMGAKTSVAKKSPQKTSPSNTKQSPEVPSLEKKTTYRSYLTRDGPRSLGTKEVPEGADNCLEGLTFVITGVLESFEREEAKHMVEKYGGKVTGSVSKKTNYLVAGRDSGESKLSKARGFGTKIIDEDELLELIRSKPGKKSKYEIQAEESIKKENSLKKSTSKLETFSKTEKLSQFERKPAQSDSSITSSLPKKSSPSETSLMWVDKYKPTALKQVIGQQGDKSNAKKLLHWLTNWNKNRAANVKPQGKFFGKDETGAGFKAALLSGPPGIGKTTTATLVCKEAGFTFVELNASDTRSKKSLQNEVSEALNNETIENFFGAEKSTARDHCLVMDEVDGMAGNEDRGGMQELVQLIKTTKIPIICMCNDRNSQKMRTLSNYCFDLRFQRPRLEQIKAAMMSIAFKEGLKVAPPALNEMIQAANQDIRQVIHNLSMWTASDKNVTYEQTHKDASQAKKDMKLGPFDVCRKVFVGGEETAGMTLIDKSDLFFHDYSFGPLFVQENYINVRPYAAKGSNTRHLSLLARTADSISDGDLVDRKIRGNQAWSLLPTQAIFASVVPGEYMRGSFPQMVAFPSWLGKNSTTNKTERIIQELRTHMRLKISGDKKSLNMDYLPHMRHSLTEPMVKSESDGVYDVIKLMDDYDIIKEDFDNIMEVSKWPNSHDPLKNLSSKTKAAFTRTYNKEVHMTPYSTGTMAKKKRGKAAADDDMDEFGEEGEGGPPVEESEEEEDMELDTMIKVKKKTTAKGKEAAAGSSKGKGPAGKSQAKGKGKGKR